MSDGKYSCRERRVGEPPHVRGAARAIKSIASDKAEVQKQTSESGKPKAPGVQAWKGHIASANHERKQIIRETEHNRHGHKENHGRAVHCEHLIEYLRRYEMIVRNDKLYAHDRRFDSADHKKHQRVQDVHDAKFFMVHRGYPVVEPIADRSGGLDCRIKCD